MRKITTSLLGVILMLTACNKQAKLGEEEQVFEKAPQARECPSHEILEQQIAANPQRGAFLNDLEIKTQDYKGRGANGRYAGKLYIPVVVHVVLPNPSSVSDDQIRSQISVLNKDFTKTNSELSNSNIYLAGYPLSDVANCQIEYVVTNVIRKQTTVSSFGTNDAVKKTSSGGSDPVDATTKLNFWVCDLSSGYLGYAQFPGGSASTDGVVIDYQAFGTTATYPMYTTFNLGRTATHEVGHWLNLRHIWGDRRCGTDYVNDTPAHDDANGGCPSTTLRSQCTGRQLEQWMNYMDYTDDRCMYMFSSGQKVRMDAAIDNARSSYVLITKPTAIL